MLGQTRPCRLGRGGACRCLADAPRCNADVLSRSRHGPVIGLTRSAASTMSYEQPDDPPRPSPPSRSVSPAASPRCICSLHPAPTFGVSAAALGLPQQLSRRTVKGRPKSRSEACPDPSGPRCTRSVKSVRQKIGDRAVPAIVGLMNRGVACGWRTIFAAGGGIGRRARCLGAAGPRF